MLYILPPPRTPNPPSPWESILYSGAASNGSTSWEGNRKPPRVRLRGLLPKNEDGSTGPQDDNMDTNRNPKSLSECYFAGKGTALVLPAAEAQKSSRRPDAQDSNIRKHLQSIVDLLRPEETLKMVSDACGVAVTGDAARTSSIRSKIERGRGEDGPRSLFSRAHSDI
jgi:hypothetical protein